MESSLNLLIDSKIVSHDKRPWMLELVDKKKKSIKMKNNRIIHIEVLTSECVQEVCVMKI